MATDLRTTQEYLNAKLGTVGLTKQQCLQRLFGAAGQGMTGQDAANNYAATGTNFTKATALRRKVGGATASNTDIYGQEAARRL